LATTNYCQTHHMPGHATDRTTHLLSSVGASKVWLQQGHWIMPVVSCLGHLAWLPLSLLSLLLDPVFAFLSFFPVVEKQRHRCVSVCFNVRRSEACRPWT
jgi:hypothetical protein